MKSNVMRRNILKLLTVVGTTLGINSLLNRNVYAFLKKPIDSIPKPIAPNSGIISQEERIVNTETAQALNDETMMSNENKLQTLKDELSMEMEKALNDSKLLDVLRKYGVANLVTIQLEVDNTKIESSKNITMDKQLKNELEAMSEDKLMIYGCLGRNLGGCRWCIPCGSCPSCF